jgi:hypothetical protein
MDGNNFILFRIDFSMGISQPDHSVLLIPKICRSKPSHCSLFSERFQQPFYHIKVTVLDTPANYRIKVRGSVPESWTDRLGGMRIVAVSSIETTLEGALPDQAALKGVLDTLYELRLSLEEVTCLEPSGVCRSDILLGTVK